MGRIASLSLVFLFGFVVISDAGDAHVEAPFGPSFGVATIDGVVTSTEWGAAVERTVQTINPVFNVTLRVMNDATNLYLGITINDDEFSTSGKRVALGDTFRIDFDDDHDGVLFEAGEDVLTVNARSPQFGDTFLSPTLDSPNRAASDEVGGGTTDGAGAATRLEGLNHFEISHPLCSGDARDFCVQAGDVVGFRLEYLDAEADGSFGGPALFPGNNVADIVIAASLIEELPLDEAVQLIEEATTEEAARIFEQTSTGKVVQVIAKLEIALSDEV